MRKVDGWEISELQHTYGRLVDTAIEEKDDDEDDDGEKVKVLVPN